MWQTHYNSSPHAYFTFSNSIIGNLHISHIIHIRYHHPTYLGDCWTNKKNKWFIYPWDLLKTWWGWSWPISIERAHLHSDKQNATNLQSMNFQMHWLNLILSFRKVWWQRHNCFEISDVALQVDYLILGGSAF
jgi:hypothetical protein